MILAKSVLQMVMFEFSTAAIEKALGLMLLLILIGTFLELFRRTAFR